VGSRFRLLTSCAFIPHFLLPFNLSLCLCLFPATGMHLTTWDLGVHIELWLLVMLLGWHWVWGIEYRSAVLGQRLMLVRSLSSDWLRCRSVKLLRKSCWQNGKATFTCSWNLCQKLALKFQRVVAPYSIYLGRSGTRWPAASLPT
jgi:hypothetical protein